MAKEADTKDQEMRKQGFGVIKMNSKIESKMYDWMQRIKRTSKSK